MTTPTRTALTIAVITAALYLPRLSRAPIYLAPDEVFTGLQAHSIATTGRDSSGRLLPLYVEYQYSVVDPSGREIPRSGWLPPMVYYAIAIVLKVLPLSEGSIRLPTILVGVLDVVLIYFAGRRLFGSEALAILCAALLAATPAHFMFSRFALDYIYPLPFLIGWLLALFAYFHDGRPRQLFGATLLLGVGIFSYIASALTMPMCFAVTIIALARDRQPARAYGIATLGFFLPALAFGLWVIAHPNALGDVLAKYDLLAPSGLNPLQSVRGLFTFRNIAEQLSRWWTFFNPRFLFFDGPMEPMFSTRAIGVFTLPIAVFLVLGLRASLRGAIGATTFVLLAGCAIAPLPATLVMVTDAIYRTLGLLPFVILLSVGGVAYLWSMPLATPRRTLLIAAGGSALSAGAVYAAGMLVLRGRMPGAAVPLMAIGGLTLAAGLLREWFRIGQLIVLVLLAAVAFQFAAFYGDYLTDYQNRVALAFGGNIRGALEEMLRQDQRAPAPAVYLAALGPKGDRAWTFSLVEHHREDLKSRTTEGAFDPDAVLRLRPGSLVVTNAGDARSDAMIEKLVAAGDVSRTVIREPNGTPTFVVLRREDKS